MIGVVCRLCQHLWCVCKGSLIYSGVNLSHTLGANVRAAVSKASLLRRHLDCWSYALQGLPFSDVLSMHLKYQLSASTLRAIWPSRWLEPMGLVCAGHAGWARGDATSCCLPAPIVKGEP